MPLEINEDRTFADGRGVIILRLSGVIDSESSHDLEAAMSRLAAESTRGMLLDLGDVRLVTSAGLRSFVLQAKTLRDRKARLVLYRLQPHVLQVLKLTGLAAMLAIVERNFQPFLMGFWSRSLVVQRKRLHFASWKCRQNTLTWQ